MVRVEGGSDSGVQTYVFNMFEAPVFLLLLSSHDNKQTCTMMDTYLPESSRLLIAFGENKYKQKGGKKG